MKNKIIDNRYIALKEIGTGGFASVYKAWASNLERFVAIKKISDEYSQDAKFLDMFRSEAVNTAKLDHQNIVRVIDFLRTSTNQYYIIMEYAKGKDLRYVMNRCHSKNIRIPFGLCMYIMCETLRALDYAYTLTDELTNTPLQIVHRDISPGNIMLYFDGRVKLTDFGIAKVSSKFGEKNKEGLLRGKVSYMSPEQANGQADLDNRSDIYSCGIVLYELLTGKRLFDGKSDYDIWALAKKAKIDLSLIQKSTYIPGKIKEILLKSLKRNRDERYTSAKAMITEILDFFKDAYAVQHEGLKEFLARCLLTEITLEENEKFDPSEIMKQVVSEEQSTEKESVPNNRPHTVPTSVEPSKPEGQAPKPYQPAQPREPAPKESLEPTQKPAELLGEKTVFDFVLDTAKRHEKILIFSFIGILIGAAGLIGIDIYRQYTSLGKKIHGRIWPPALTIDSLPKSATVSIRKDGEEFIQGVSQTPLYIDKIVPGNYLLTIRKEGFRVIERKISVRGKGNIRPSGAVFISETQKNYFLFTFEAHLKITSRPPGASVYIDGKKLPGTTPLVHYAAVGTHTIQLFLDGFNPLGSSDRSSSYGQCVLDLENLSEKQKGIDHRYWTFERRIKGDEHELILKGTFWKSMNIATVPRGSKIFLDDRKDPLGTTPLKSIRLKVGKHRLRITKKGYQTKEDEINISPDIKDTLSYQLKRYIWFKSVSRDNLEKDLKALVTLKGTSIKNKKAPFRTALPLRKYSVRFTKEPRYKPKTIPFDLASHTVIRAVLQLRNPYIKFSIKDEENQDPIPNAYILFNDIYQGSTNDKGIWEDVVPPGEYTIKINTGERFPEKALTKTLKAGTRQTQEIFLSLPTDCTLDIDTRPHFIGAQIYVDGNYENETIRKIKKMTRDTHTILIRHYDLENDIQANITFKDQKQTIKIRLNERGEFIIKSD